MNALCRRLLLRGLFAAALAVLGCGAVNPPADMPAGNPKVEKVMLSGCHREVDTTEADDKTYPYCGDESLELSVEAGKLHVLHRNAAYNCCIDNVTLSAVLDGDTLILTERESTSMPCRCMCCYDVEATITDLAPGKYTVEFCRKNTDGDGPTCETQTVVIP
ncbi:MAG: hypothetical protein GXY44_03805 [Phycisphaerales bacterium]|nr:hypothetical protein [Phycisphaerales bacterium]